MTKKILSTEEKIDNAISLVENLHESKKSFIKDKIDFSFAEKCSLGNLKTYITRNILDLRKPLNRSTKEYWLKRGWSEYESNKKAKEYSKKMKKNYQSPFGKQYWIERGYSEEEAEYLRNSKRPIRKEYWIERGYSEEEAQKKAIETKDNNNKKGAKKSASRPKNDFKINSKRCKEYYIYRGYSEDEAEIMVSEYQNNFTVEKCIEKHGIEKGIEIYNDRQKRWQETLSNKPQYEIDEINKKKNAISLKHFSNIEECIKTLKTTRNIDLFDNIEDFLYNFKNNVLKNSPYMVYWPIEKIMISFIPNIQKEIIDAEVIKENIKPLLKSEEMFLMKNKNKQAYRKWTDEGLLRSSYEIYFYDKFTSLHPDKKLKIDKPYPNSNFRYDFFVDNQYYIEICPLYDKDENYRNKMLKKQKIFNCILLKTIQEIDNFVERLQ